MFLRDDLQGITNADGEHAAIDDGRHCQPDAVEAGFFEYRRKDQAEHSTGNELYERQTNSVVAADEKTYQQTCTPQTNAPASWIQSPEATVKSSPMLSSAMPTTARIAPSQVPMPVLWPMISPSKGTTMT
jgi:hypothetical protein